MENKKCFYLVEGECEEKLLKALKGQPALINPGTVKNSMPFRMKYRLPD